MTEGEGVALVTVTRSTDFGKMQVDLLAKDGTATNNVDFKIDPSGTNLITLTFDHLQTAVTVPVEIFDNSSTNGADSTGKLELANVRPALDERSFITGMVQTAKSKADLSIVNNDVELQFNFDKLLYTIPEPLSNNSAIVEIVVKLAAPPGEGSSGVEVDYIVTTDPAYGTRAGSDYASPGADYEPQNGTLTFAEDTTQQSIFVVITNDSELEFNEDLHVVLTEARGTKTIEPPPATDGGATGGTDAGATDAGATGGTDAGTDGGATGGTDGGAEPEELTFTLGRGIVATVTILYNREPNPPAGSVDVRFNADNSPNTNPPLNQSPGANNTVFGVAVDARTNTIVVGDFTAMNAVPMNRIARLNSTGQLDPTFTLTSGANNFVTAVAVYTNGTRNGQILVGGGFTAINGEQRNGVARLLTNGLTDLTFNPGTGADGPVYAIALQRDGNILVGGDFTTFNGIPRNRIVRLLPDGAVDLSFDPGTGADGPVFSVHSLSADPIIFREALTNGPVATFSRTVSVGASSGFLLLTYNFFNASNDIQVLAGTTPLFYSGLVTNEQIGTNAVGDLVTNSPPAVVAIEFTTANSNLTFIVNLGGTNESTNWVYTVEIQPQIALGSIIGGDFRVFNGIEHGSIAKLDGNGSVDTNFNTGTGIGADGTVYAVNSQDGRVLLGGAFRSFNSFEAPGLARLDADGRFDRTFAVGDAAANGIVNAITLQGDDKILVGGSFTYFNQTRRIFLTRLLTNGPIDTTFLDPSYNQYAGFPDLSGLEPIGFVNSIAVDQNGDVLAGGAFSHVGGGFTRTEIRPRNNVARLHGGETAGPGNVQFVQRLFGGDENGASVGLTLSRTNGSLGSGVVLLTTVDGAATSPDDYVGRTNAAVQWLPIGPQQAFGSTDPAFLRLQINDDTVIEGDEQFAVIAASPMSTMTLGGEFIPAGLALGNLQVVSGAILENDVPPAVIQFSQAEYDANEHDVVRVTVTRTGNESSAVGVRYSTSSPNTADAATAVLDYTPASQSLNFLSGQTSKEITISLRDDRDVEQDERILISLSGLGQNAAFGTNSTTVVNIVDNDYAPGRVSLSATNYVVSEGEDEAVITVRRTGGNSGVLRVNYETIAGAAGAPFDFLEARGTLLWNDRDTAPRTIVIPILEDGLVEGNEQLTLRLSGFNPAGATGARTNAVVTIADNDSLGAFAFNAVEYLADENGTNIIINVVRRDGSAEVATVEYTTTNLTAQAGQDYEAASGTLVFGVNETSKSFAVRLIDNEQQNVERQFNVVLRNPGPAGATLGLLTNAVVSIIDNELVNIPAGSVDTDFATQTGADRAVHAIELMPDGRILIAGDFDVVNRQVRTRLARLHSDGSLDAGFGADYEINDSVRDIELLNDGRLIIAGSFTDINGLPVRRLARISSSGVLDSTFDIGAGADNPIFAVAEVTDGFEQKVLIGGSFTTFNGVQRRGIARVSATGRTDTTFDPGAGVNGTVYAIEVQRDGKILIGGEFSSVNGITRINIARLNADGSLDEDFDGGLGADGSVRSIEVQFDDRILIGGLFTSVSSVTRQHIARLNSDGTLDSSFNPGGQVNGAVYAIALQLDGRIVVGGDFTSFNGVPVGRIVRLNPDGSVDPSINFGTGADAFVGALLIQPDRAILVGGGFDEFDGLHRGGYARVYGGSLRGAGELEFAVADFPANENSTNVIINVRRSGGLLGAVTVDFSTRQRTASASVDYDDVSGTLSFAAGENMKSFSIPLRNDNIAEPVEIVDLTLSNPVGGAVLGRQPVATLSIISDDSVISFRELIYSVNEAAAGGRAVIEIIREGEASLPVSVVFSATAGTATAGSDFRATNRLVTIAAGQSNAVVSVPILEDLIVEETETVLLRLTSPGVGGILGVPSASLTILDNDNAAGVLSVLDPPPVTENAGSTGITVTRSSGRTGAISVRYALRNGTASVGQDFGAASGTLSFLEGETTKTFIVPILDDTANEGNESFQVELFEPGGGASIATRFTPVLILDDDFGPGSLDTSFNVGSAADAPVRDIDIQADGKILVGGEFVGFNGFFVGGITRLNPDGSLDSSYFGSGVDGAVFSLSQTSDGKVSAGGNFTIIEGFLPRPFVARFDTNGLADTTFFASAGENARVLAVEAQDDGKVVVGGDFTTPTRHILRLNSDGTLDVSFSPDGGTDAPVRDIAIQSDGRILIAGDFTRVGNVAVRGIARLLPTGLLDSSFRIGQGANGSVHAVVIAPDGKILIGGNFTSVNNASRTRVARLNPDGSVDASFNLPGGADAAVNAVLIARGKIYIAGEFTTAGSVPRVRVARLEFDGTLDAEFNPGTGPDGPVYALAGQENGQVLIGGDFNTVNGYSTPGIARINGEKVTASESRVTGARIAGGAIQLTFTSEIGLAYVIEGSDDLRTWVPIETMVASSSSTNFSAPANEPRKFYRVRVNP